jgi:hypothetical protein
LNNNLFRLKADYNAAVTFYDDDDIDYIAWQKKEERAISIE